MEVKARLSNVKVQMGSSASKEPVMTVRLKPGALMQLDQLYIVRTEVVKSEGCFGGSAQRREESETKATIDALKTLCIVAKKSDRLDRNFDRLAALSLKPKFVRLCVQ